MFAYGIAASRLRFGAGRRRAARALHGPGAAAPVRRVPRRDRHRVGRPGVRGRRGRHANRDQHWLTFGLRARVFHGLTARRGHRRRPALGRLRVRAAAAALRPDLRRRRIRSTSARSRGRSSSRGRSRRPPRADAWGPSSGIVKNKARRQADRRGGGVVRGPAARRASRPIRTAASRACRCRPGPAEVTVARRRASSRRRARRTSSRARRRRSRSRWSRKVVNGNVRGKVTDRAGRGVAATLRFNGAEHVRGAAPTRRARSRRRCRPGPTGSPSRRRAARPRRSRSTSSAGQDRQLDVTLRPANPDVTPDRRRRSCCACRSSSRPGAPKLTPPIKAELEAVADILADHPEIKTLRIEAHWSGGRAGKGGDSRQEADRRSRPRRSRTSWSPRARRPTAIETVGPGASRPWCPTWARPTRPRTAGSSWSSCSRRPVGPADGGGRPRAWL